MFLITNWASAWANHNAVLSGQKGGNFTATAETFACSAVRASSRAFTRSSMILHKNLSITIQKHCAEDRWKSLKIFVIRQFSRKSCLGPLLMMLRVAFLKCRGHQFSSTLRNWNQRLDVMCTVNQSVNHCTLLHSNREKGAKFLTSLEQNDQDFL